MLSALFLAVYIVCLTTAQHTYIYDDESDMRCEDTCGRQLDDLRQVQKELQQQIQELTRTVKQISGKAGAIFWLQTAYYAWH